MRYLAKKKASEQHVFKKPTLSRAQEEARKAKLAESKYNINTRTKRKHIENNRTVLPFLAKKEFNTRGGLITIDDLLLLLLLLLVVLSWL